MDRLNSFKQMAEADPRFMNQFMAYKSSLQQQAGTAEDLDFSRMSPTGQQMVVGKSTGRVYGVNSAPGWVSDAGPKMVSDGRGGFAPIPSTQSQTISGAGATSLGYGQGTVLQHDPTTGQDKVSQGVQFGPNDVLSQRQNFINGDTYQTLAKTTRAINSVQRILAGSANNNGAVDAGVSDNLVQVETGLSAKQGSMKMLADSYDLPASLQNQVAKLTGDGSITPEHLAQMLNVLHAYYGSHSASARQELDGLNGTIGSLSGGAYKDVGVKLPQVEPMPNAPWMQANNPANPASPANPPPPPAPQGPRLTPQQAAALPKGTSFVGTDGIARVRQ